MLVGECAGCRADATVLGEGEIETVVIPPASEEDEGERQDGNQEEI